MKSVEKSFINLEVHLGEGDPSIIHYSSEPNNLKSLGPSFYPEFILEDKRIPICSWKIRTSTQPEWLKRPVEGSCYMQLLIEEAIF